MDLSKLSAQGIGPLGPAKQGPAAEGPRGPASPAGAEFRQALEQASQAGPTGATAPAAPAPLATAPQLVQAPRFSAHAVERMRSRGIAFSPDEARAIEGAVAKAAQKGSKDALVLAGENALIVSVKNNTVVTVMDKNAMRESVFTNIDSAVVI
jgi:flagellar operon protein